MDYYILILEDKDHIITIYSNNLLIIVLSITRINELKKLLIRRFKILEIGLVIKYLSIKIKRRLDSIVLY